VPSFLSVATTGSGVNETLKKVIELVIRKLQASDSHFGGHEAETPQRPPEKAPEPAPAQTPAPSPEEESAPEPVRPTQVAKPDLPEVELEEETSPSFAEDDEMEAVEIETLQEVEPLPVPTGSARTGGPPIEGIEPNAVEVQPELDVPALSEPEMQVTPEPEPEPVEVFEPGSEPIEIPAPEPEVLEISGEDIAPPVPLPGMDLEILRAALAALQERAEALAARTRDLDEETQAFKEQIEALNHLLLG